MIFTGEGRGFAYELLRVAPGTVGQAWTTERDYPALIASAAELLSPDGVLWLACNTHQGSPLGKLAQRGFDARAMACLGQWGLGADYPTLAAQPKDRYLQIAAFRPQT